MQTIIKTADELVPGDRVVIPGTTVALAVESTSPRVRIGEDATLGRHTLIEIKFDRYQYSTVERGHKLQVQA
jgi:hypothetical protein